MDALTAQSLRLQDDEANKSERRQRTVMKIFNTVSKQVIPDIVIELKSKSNSLAELDDKVKQVRHF
jgi:Uma2 family endonuclease